MLKKCLKYLICWILSNVRNYILNNDNLIYKDLTECVFLFNDR